MNNKAMPMEDELNMLYKMNQTEYIQRVTYLKSMGCKIYRNSSGKHIIKYNVDDVINSFYKIKEEQQKKNIDLFMQGFLGKYKSDTKELFANMFKEDKDD